jgi:ribosomal-protein-alanine N-acetyltransferase
VDALPSLQTARLFLRPFTGADAPDVQRMVSDREVAATTLSIPHPYPAGGAEEWIAKQQETFEKGESATFAITLQADRSPIGSISLRITAAHRHAELGYLIDKPYWASGYATEAARAVMHFGFETLSLNRIYAHHMTINPSSGRVMQKLGMRFEGIMREHIIKWGELRDVALYGLTRAQYDAMPSK